MILQEEYNLNLESQLSKKYVKVSQYDTGRRLLITLLKNDCSMFKIPSEASASINGLKPDGKGFRYDCSIENNKVVVDMKEQMTVLAGYVKCEILLSKGGERIATANFMLSVEESPLSENTPISSTDIPLLQKAIEASETVLSVEKTVKGYSESASKSSQSAQESAESASSASASSAESARNSSQSAQASAESANNASQSATNAQESAESASNSAREAKTSADSAIQTKAEVEQLKKETKAEADKATEASTEAKAQAERASSFASNASASADTATSASASASSSAQSAIEASNSADASASSSAQSATNASKSAEKAKASEEKSLESASSSKEYYDKIVTTQFPYNLEGFSQLEKEITARYESARTGKVFAIRHKKFAVDPSPIGEKLLDSVGLECTPSTDTVQGKDDFMSYLPFQWEHCNYIRDEDDGFARPTAIEGRENYKNSGNVDVGCISATFWWKRVDTEADYTIYLSDMPHPELALVPWYEAVKADGSVLPYYIGSAYSSVNGDDGLPRSIPGGVPLYNQSHNGIITAYQKKGKGYWGCGDEYVTHGAIFSEIKYGTPNIQQYAQGCVGFNVQKKCAVAENATTRVLLDKQDVFYVGCCVSVGVARSSDGNTDRGLAEIHSIANRVKVKAIETVEIEGVAYCALYLDVDTPFDTNTEVYVSSMPCFTGETDAVIDHYDGSFMSYSNNCHTFRLHGREYLDGMYFTSANTALLMKERNWHVMHVRKGMQHNTELTGYDDVGYIPYNDGTDYWCGDFNCDMATGVSYPSSVGKSNVMGAGDMVYAGGKNVKEGEKRNHLSLGALWDWSVAGLFCVDCRNGLGYGWWNFASRD